MINHKLIDNCCGKHLAITMCAYKEAKIITWKISPKPNESRLVAICLTLAYQIVVFETNKKTIQYLCVTKSRDVFDVHHERWMLNLICTPTFNFTGQLQVHNPKEFTTLSQIHQPTNFFKEY